MHPRIQVPKALMATLEHSCTVDTNRQARGCCRSKRSVKTSSFVTSRQVAFGTVSVSTSFVQTKECLGNNDGACADIQGDQEGSNVISLRRRICSGTRWYCGSRGDGVTSQATYPPISTINPTELKRTMHQRQHNPRRWKYGGSP